MAKKKPAEGEGAAEKKGGKKKLIIVLVLVLGLAGAGYKFFLAPTPKPGPPKPGTIVTMDPTTLNLADGHYLKIGVALQLIEGKGAAEGEGATTFPVSHAQELVIDEFTGREVKTLTNENRKKIGKELGKKIKEAYEGEIYTIYITQFVIQ